ncbi:MAG: hypothetical protein ACRCYX_04770, partial [Dermatophilaceae bacterium]
EIHLDFESAESQIAQRLNYRFDAVAAVRVHAIATPRQTFEMTLVNGAPISVPVGTSDSEEGDADEHRVTTLSLDASGFNHTLQILEGIAAEGKAWVVHRRRRADERLADLAATFRGLLG